MVRRDGAYTKKLRLDKITKAITQSFDAGGVPYEKLITWIQFEEGLTRSTAEEYIELILQAKGWILIDGKIVAQLPES